MGSRNGDFQRLAAGHGERPCPNHLALGKASSERTLASLLAAPDGIEADFTDDEVGVVTVGRMSAAQCTLTPQRAQGSTEDTPGRQTSDLRLVPAAVDPAARSRGTTPKAVAVRLNHARDEAVPYGACIFPVFAVDTLEVILFGQRAQEVDPSPTSYSTQAH